jgi:probable addiction module antidote protein
MTEIKPFDASQYLDDPQTVLAYLTETFESVEPSAMVAAIHTAARAYGLEVIADKTGLSCEDLEKIGTATEFGTVVRILRAMELSLVVSAVIDGAGKIQP